MKTTLLAAATLLTLAAAAQAETKLTTTVHTASPGGFYVDSTLVAGEKDAILVDAQFALADAHRLVATILESKKNLTAVYITHYHPDHYFGLQVIQQAFPKAKLYALPAAIKQIKATAKAKAKYWGGMYGSNVPTKPVQPTALKGTTLTLEGQTLEIKAGVGDSADNTYVWIPSTKTVIAGDIVFNGVHAWTAESNAASRASWVKTLDEIAALNPSTVIAGHKDPKLADSPTAVKATKDYLAAFDAAVASSKTSAEVQQKLKAKYGALQLDIILQVGADAAYPPAK